MLLNAQAASRIISDVQQGCMHCCKVYRSTTHFSPHHCKLEKERKDYAFRLQVNEKPSITPGCPSTASYSNVCVNNKSLSFGLLQLHVDALYQNLPKLNSGITKRVLTALL